MSNQQDGFARDPLEGDPLISNLENLEGDALISTYAAAAAYWGLPVWAMMVPGTTRDMFEDIGKIKRLVQLMNNYLDCPDTERSHVEAMAAGLAKISRKRAAAVTHG
jgi:hypothetical protein